MVITIGALSISGNVARRAPYEPFLMTNVHQVSACNAYRQRLGGESDASFVGRKAAELEAKFQELGPETVVGFVAEPVVGAALGCVPSVPGYLKAMRDVCHKHGALLVFDEVMSGMGRCGTLHAWQDEDIVPDIQIIGKGLGGGYQPIAAVLISHNVANALLMAAANLFTVKPTKVCQCKLPLHLRYRESSREENLMENVSIQRRPKRVLVHGCSPTFG